MGGRGCAAARAGWGGRSSSAAHYLRGIALLGPHDQGTASSGPAQDPRAREGGGGSEHCARHGYWGRRCRCRTIRQASRGWSRAARQGWGLGPSGISDSPVETSPVSAHGIYCPWIDGATCVGGHRRKFYTRNKEHASTGQLQRAYVGQAKDKSRNKMAPEVTVSRKVSSALQLAALDWSTQLGPRPLHQAARHPALLLCCGGGSRGGGGDCCAPAAAAVGATAPPRRCRQRQGGGPSCFTM